MTKEKIKELLQGVYSGWKNIDAVADEIHESINAVMLPYVAIAMDEEDEDDEVLSCVRCGECEGDCLCEEND